MRNRLINNIVLFSLLFTVPFFAQPISFSDDYVSFSYDEEQEQLITKTTMKDSIWYYVETDLQTRFDSFTPSSSVSIRLEKNTEENFLDSFFFLNKIPDSVIVEDLSDKEKKYIYQNGSIMLRKVLVSHEDQFIVASFSTTDFEKDSARYCKTVYDSISPSDIFSANGLPSEKSFGWSTKTIFRNAIFSREIRDYVEQGIRICERFLSYNISDEEYQNKLLALRDAIKIDFIDSEYLFDMTIIELIPDSSIFLIDSNNIEVHAIETKQELENILQEIDEQYP